MSHHHGDPHHPTPPPAAEVPEVNPEHFLEGIKTQLEYTLPNEQEFLNLIDQLKANHVNKETIEQYLAEIKHMKDLLLGSLKDMKSTLNGLPSGTEIPSGFEDFFNPSDLDKKNILNRENAINIINDLIVFLETQYKKLTEKESEKVRRGEISEFLAEGKFFTGKDILQAVKDAGGEEDVDILVQQLQGDFELYQAFQESPQYKAKDEFFDRKVEEINRQTFFPSPELQALEDEVQKQSVFLFENENTLKGKGQYKAVETALRAKIAERDALLGQEKAVEAKKEARIRELNENIEKQRRFLDDNERLLQANGKYAALKGALDQNDRERDSLIDEQETLQSYGRSAKLQLLYEERDNVRREEFKKFIPANRAVEILAFTDTSFHEIIKKLAEKIAPGSVTFEMIFEMPDEVIEEVINAMPAKQFAMEVKRQGPLFWSKAFGERLLALRKTYDKVVANSPFAQFPTDYERKGVSIEKKAPDFVHNFEHSQEEFVHAVEGGDKKEIAKAKAVRNRLFEPEILRIANQYRLARAINGYPTEFDPQGDLKNLKKYRYTVGKDVTGYPNEIKRVEFALQTFDQKTVGRGTRIMVDENDNITINFKNIDDPSADILFDALHYPHITPDKIAFAFRHAYDAAEKPTPLKEVQDIHNHRDALSHVLEKVNKVRYFKTALRSLYGRLSLVEIRTLPPEDAERLHKQYKGEFDALNAAVSSFNRDGDADALADLMDVYGEEFGEKYQKFIHDEQGKIRHAIKETEVSELVSDINGLLTELERRSEFIPPQGREKPIDKQIAEWLNEPVRSKQNVLREVATAQRRISLDIQDIADSNTRVHEYEQKIKPLVDAQDFNKDIKYSALGSLLFSTKKRAWMWDDANQTVMMEDLTEAQFGKANKRIEAEKRDFQAHLEQEREAQKNVKDTARQNLQAASARIETALDGYKNEPGLTLSEFGRFQKQIQGVWEMFCAQIEAQIA